MISIGLLRERTGRVCVIPSPPADVRREITSGPYSRHVIHAEPVFAAVPLTLASTLPFVQVPQLRRALATLEPAWELRVDALRKVAAEAQNLSRVATKYSPGVVDEVNCTRMLVMLVSLNSSCHGRRWR